MTLRDGAIELSSAQVAAGSIRFEARNAGSTIHELELFRLPDDVDGSKLPISNGVADTSGLALVDEVEDIAPATGAPLMVTLSAGRYLLICNLPGHYQTGMHAQLTVS